MNNPNDSLPASRPGMKTLILIVGAILLFVIIKFWSELTSVFHVG
jgi:hypothetical protein